MNNMTILSSSNYGQFVYENTIEAQISVASLALLVYASLLQISDEIEYIWKRKFTLTNILYILAKYPLFVYQSFSLAVILSLINPISSCNKLGYTADVIAILPYAGVQGLIVFRAYSICQGHLRMILALSITFFISLALQFYVLARSDSTPEPSGFFLIHIILTTLTDTLAFITVIREVWSIWKLKRGLGLQSNEDLATSLLRQGILRFCFLFFIGTTQLILTTLELDVVEDCLVAFRNVLSSLLICEFTIELRRQNAKGSVSYGFGSNLPNVFV